MEDKEKKRKEIREKIVEGLTLSFRRLVEEKKKNDEYLIFSKDGKIVKIKARDL
jgi:hypothetical protein